MSLPGTVDPERRVSLDSPVMRGWDGVELAPYLSGVGDAPLYLTNDTSALARSELFGREVPASDVLVVKASTGLGLGVIADGRLVNEHRRRDRRARPHPGRRRRRPAVPVRRDRVPRDDRRRLALVTRLQERASRSGTCATW